VELFSAAVNGRLLRTKENMNGAKYRESLDENLLQSAQDLRLERRFTFQRDNDPQFTAKPNAGVYGRNSPNTGVPSL
jgi:hypothetical protein